MRLTRLKLLKLSIISRKWQKRELDLNRELDFKVEHSDSDTIFIIPNVTFAKGELYKGKSEEFTKDYLKTYATADGIIVDFGKVETLG